jgi:uncharacterized membrane protein
MNPVLDALDTLSLYPSLVLLTGFVAGVVVAKLILDSRIRSYKTELASRGKTLMTRSRAELGVTR